jgi:hypothetical protein
MLRVSALFNLAAVDGARVATYHSPQGNPVVIFAQQLNLKLYKLSRHCPLYDSSGKPVDLELDERMEQYFNRTLDAASKFPPTVHTSLGKAIEQLIQENPLTPEERAYTLASSPSN